MTQPYLKLFLRAIKVKPNLRPTNFMLGQKRISSNSTVTKLKELTITFTYSHQEANFPPIHVEGNPIKTVTNAKLLGVTINSKLSSNDYIENLVKKASRKLYFLVHLKRAKVSSANMVTYYCTCIRSSSDYACQVFHHGLPKYLHADLVSIQKRAMHFIFPNLPYSAALVKVSKFISRIVYITHILYTETISQFTTTAIPRKYP